jgi:hypothetical protein
MKCQSCPFQGQPVRCLHEPSGTSIVADCGRTNTTSHGKHGLEEIVATGAKAFARYVASGMKNVDAEVAAEREAICRACPELDQEADKCRVCGCMFMKAKRAMASEACPLAKW